MFDGPTTVFLECCTRNPARDLRRWQRLSWGRHRATVPPLPPETSPPRSRGQELLKIKGFGPKSTFGSDDTGRLVFSSPTGTISRCGKRSHQERWINSPPSSPEAFNSPLASYGSSVARSLWMRCPSTPKAPRQRYDVFGLPALRAS